MSDAVLIGIGAALITTVGAIIIAMLNKTRKHSKATINQLENNHIQDDKKIPNIRENIDFNQQQITQYFDRIDEKIDGIIDTQRRQTNKLDKLFSVTQKHTAQIEKIIKGE